MPTVRRLSFIYDEDNRPIGKVDEDGNVYTLKGRRSTPYIPTEKGLAMNKSHAKREGHAKNSGDE